MPKVTAFGGVGEIGGNRLLVETDVRIFLDFGTSYRVYKRFFHEYLKPRKVSALADYFRMGLAPDLRGVYRPDFLRQLGRAEEPRGVDAVVVSHPHLDHAGLLPLLRADIPILLSAEARGILRAIADTGQKGYVSHFLAQTEQFAFRGAKTGPPRRLKADADDLDTVSRPLLTEEKFEVGRTRVLNFPVDHSIPGARATLVEGPDGTVAYTGDLRQHGRRRERTERFLKRIGGVDHLIVEGTNLGNGRDSVPRGDEGSTKFIPEAEVAKTIAEEVAAAEGFCFVNYPSRDLDRLVSFHEAARRTDRRLLVTTKQAHLLRILAEEGAEAPRLDDPHLGVYLPRRDYGLIDKPRSNGADGDLLRKEYEWYERPFLASDSGFTAAAVRKEPGAFLVPIDLYNLTELVDLDPPSGTYILSKTEPHDLEMEIDEDRLEAWAAHFHLRVARRHASGHFTPDDLWAAIDAVGPRRVIPVHTQNEEAFEARFPGRVSHLALAQEVVL